MQCFIIIITIFLKLNTSQYHCFTLVYHKSWWYDLKFLRQCECDIVWQTEIGNYGSFFALLHPVTPPPPFPSSSIKFIFFILGYFLSFTLQPPTPPPSLCNSPKKQNFKKIYKSTWRYHHFTQVYQKLWSWCMVPETDRRTDVELDRKSDIWRWVPHLKISKISKMK